MIYRNNYLDVKAYLRYLEVVLQQDPQTVDRRREQLRHLLEWADETPLWKASRLVKPTFPAYLVTARNDGRQKQTAPGSLAATCNTTKRFYTWARAKWPHRYGSVSLSWIATIVPPRGRGAQSEVRVHTYYSLEEMKKIAAIKPDCLRDERDQAAMCFMWLSGMRVFAFVTLPIYCVDLAGMRVSQLPGEGVHTKNSKAAITSLYQVDDLLDVVKRWDEKVRAGLPRGAMWYSTLDQSGCELVPLYNAKAGRREMIKEGIKNICALAGIEYKSSHKLRHGNGVFGLKNVRDMAGLKSVSQNLMHSSVTITDSIYGTLSSDDVHRVIVSLKEKDPPRDGRSFADADLIEKLEELLRQAGK